MKPFALNKLNTRKYEPSLNALPYRIWESSISGKWPLTQMKAIRNKLNETEEAKTLLLTGASVPIPSLEGIEMILDLLGTGYVLSERDFGNMVQYLRSAVSSFSI